MTTVNASLEVISQNSTQPVRKILAFDYKAMVALGLLLVGLILLFNMLLIRPVLEVVSDFRSNVDWSTQPSENEIMLEPDILGGGGEIPLTMLLGDSADGPALIWQILEWIVTFIALPLFGLVVIVVVFRFIQGIIKRWRFKETLDAELDDGFADIKEFIRMPSAGKRWRRDSRNEHKIRRLFRETVTRHIKKGVPITKSDTPIQMTEKIQGKDIATLADDYAAVRYK